MKKGALVFGLFLALVFSFFAHAGEIHDAASAGDLYKVRALIEADPDSLEAKDNI